MHEPRRRLCRPLIRLAVPCLVAVAVAATTATAARTGDSLVPKPAVMLLKASDFAGRAKLVGHVTGDAKSSRTFGPGLRMGSVWLLAVYTGAVVRGGSEYARREFVDDVHRLGRSRERVEDVEDMAEYMFGKGVKPEQTRVGPLVRAGANARYFMGSMRFKGATVRIGLATLQVDRGYASIGVLGLVDRDLYRRNVERLIAIAVERMRAAFAITVKAPPSIVGTADVGQVLSVDEGTWTGAPEFTYSWSQCDEAGATCVPVDGQTTRAYFVEPKDVGKTLRVTVQGKNSLGVAEAATPVTKLVTG